jgi:hypothetical protein
MWRGLYKNRFDIQNKRVNEPWRHQIPQAQFPQADDLSLNFEAVVMGAKGIAQGTTGQGFQCVIMLQSQS